MTPTDDNIVSLPNEHPAPTEPEPTPPGRLHGASIAGMAACALIGIVAMLAFVTVNMPGTIGRYMVGAIVVAGIGFLAFASAAVLTAARDTYGRGSRPKDE